MGMHLDLFICEVCHKHFACKQTLKKHQEESHEESKKTCFTCEACGLQCTNRRNLEAHQKVHNEISEGYECELCPAPTYFKQARNLRRHYVSYHNIVPAIYLQHPRLL